jgi:hypothetical protein
MKKLLLLTAVLAAFSVSSVFAGKCPGSGCGDKDKDDTKDDEKKSFSIEIGL